MENKDLKTKKILWVDDEPESLKIYRKYLESLGFYVDIAENVDDAYKQIVTEKYIIIILDIIIAENRYKQDIQDFNEEAGLYLLKKIKENSSVRETETDVSLLIVSAVIRPEIREKIFQIIPEKYFVNKPIFLNDFVERFQSLFLALI